MADPIAPFNFEVLITPSGQGGDDGTARIAAFSAVSGLEISIETVPLREGGYNSGTRQLLGKASSPALVLKRGLTSDRSFWEWVQRCFDGPYPLPYATAEVNLFAADGELVARYTARNAICTKVHTADPDASSTQIAIEELTLTHEGLFREAL